MSSIFQPLIATYKVQLLGDQTLPLSARVTLFQSIPDAALRAQILAQFPPYHEFRLKASDSRGD